MRYLKTDFYEIPTVILIKNSIKVFLINWAFLNSVQTNGFLFQISASISSSRNFNFFLRMNRNLETSVLRTEKFIIISHFLKPLLNFLLSLFSKLVHYVFPKFFQHKILTFVFLQKEIPILLRKISIANYFLKIKKILEF